MFSELLVSGSEDVLKYHRNKNMKDYRNHLEDKMGQLMYTSEPDFLCFSYNKKIVNGKLNTFRGNIKLEEINRLPKFSNFKLSVDLKKYIVRQYWDENTESFCHIGPENCKNILEEMILCQICNHWYHPNCVGLQKKPKYFICLLCNSE